MGFVHPQHDISLNLSGTTPLRGTSHIPPLVYEAHRITDQFREDFRVLKAKVTILEAENLVLRRMVEDLLTPIRAVLPSPPKDQD